MERINGPEFFVDQLMKAALGLLHLPINFGERLEPYLDVLDAVEFVLLHGL